jgi:hypothetical protein
MLLSLRSLYENTDSGRRLISAVANVRERPRGRLGEGARPFWVPLMALRRYIGDHWHLISSHACPRWNTMVQTRCYVRL